MQIKELKAYFRQLANDKLPYHWLESHLLWVLQKTPSFLITDENYHLTADEYSQLQQGLIQLQQGVPLAYIWGFWEFWGRRFMVNEHTLIPRPDTELLVELVLNWVQDKAMSAGEILELGVGTGCVAITLAKELPYFNVLGVDVSKPALEVARHNAKALQADNCQLLPSNWFDKVQGCFDVIVSNPPYIDEHDEHLADLTAEPMSALVAGESGLSDIKIIINNAPKFLKPNGLLLIEHGYEQAKQVQAVFCEHGFYDVVTIKDYGGNDRVTLGVFP